MVLNLVHWWGRDDAVAEMGNQRQLDRKDQLTRPWLGRDTQRDLPISAGTRISFNRCSDSSGLKVFPGLQERSADNGVKNLVFGF